MVANDWCIKFDFTESSNSKLMLLLLSKVNIHTEEYMAENRHLFVKLKMKLPNEYSMPLWNKV